MIEVRLLNTPGAMRSCLAGWQDILGIANNYRGGAGLPPLFRCRILGTGARALAAAGSPGLVLLPVALGNRGPRDRNPPLETRLAEWHRDGVMLASACAGSFTLASAGLLDGRRCTTHWSLAAEFRQRFPRAELEIGELLVETPAGPGGRPGALLCGGGITAYVDVALAVIARFGGQALAEAVARILLWDPHRPRQAVWADGPAPAIHGDEALLRAEAWLEPRLAQAVRLEDWADAAGLGLRTFERRFRAVHGQAPGLWLRRRRLNLARELLATSQRSWEEIALAAGYQDPGSLRQLFVREFGLAPREFRQRFGIPGARGLPE
jgi:transcriptional regulator GlxA family with amidase domain